MSLTWQREVRVAGHGGPVAVHDALARLLVDAAAPLRLACSLGNRLQEILNAVALVEDGLLLLVPGDDLADVVQLGLRARSPVLAHVARDVDRVHTSEEIVPVAHNLLVCALQEEAQIVRQALQRVELDSALAVDEMANLAIAVTRDVGQARVDGRFLIQPMDGHNGEELLDCPRVGCRAEERPVAEIHRAELRAIEQALQVRVVDGADPLQRGGDLVQDRSVDALGACALRQAAAGEDEHGLEIALELLRMMEELLCLDDVTTLQLAVLQNVQQLRHNVVISLIGLYRGLRPGYHRAADAQNAEHEHAEMGSNRTATLAREDGARQLAARAGFHHSADNAVRVGLHCVVLRAGRPAVRAVVVDCKAAANVKVAHVAA
eukprot:m.33968 g.33968  ORF g.33968 m.33968 type:complete len:378 (+) comp5162_c0_seq1:406-1539(+)